MFSILIPTYNRCPVELIDQLISQAGRLSISVEIIVVEDGSSEEYLQQNEGLKNKKEITYLIETTNRGRSSIRNYLAKKAKFAHLLYLDCDSRIDNPIFLEVYSQYIGKEDVVYGGTSYLDSQHKDTNNLHYQFGVEREALSSEERSKNPWLNFKTNNFFIRRELILEIPFDESIKGYGYEDVVFAEDLHKNGINIVHINNPVVHEGLESNEEFLAKTRESVQNLAYLVYRQKISKTRLTQVYERIKWSIVLAEKGKMLENLRKVAFNNLQKGRGGNFLFSIWKLLVYHQEQKSLPKIR